MIVSYGSQVWGNVALNVAPVVLNSGNNEFSFKVDGSDYTINIAPGIYRTSKEHFQSELINPINLQLQQIDAPVFARLGGISSGYHINVLIIEHIDKINSHIIDSFSGTARSLIYGETQFTEPPRQI